MGQPHEIELNPGGNMALLPEPDPSPATDVN